MKTQLLILVLFVLPILAFSQTQSDYEHVVGKFMKFYNNKQPDSINNLFADLNGKKFTSWNKKGNDELMSHYGKMKSYKYIDFNKEVYDNGQEEVLAYFKVVFDRSKHFMSISLDKQNKLGTFRFKTTDPHIDSLVKKGL